MYQAVISFLSNYPTGFRIVTGLFILFIPFLQLKGRDLRVCDFYLSFLFKYFFAAPYMIVIVCSATMFCNPIHSAKIFDRFHFIYLIRGNDADQMFNI